jgi:hypothetical protein
MESNIMMVFTRESMEEILRQGGSKSWKLNKNRAQMYSYLICTRNNPGRKEGVEPHGQAFLIAKIKNLVPSPDPKYPGRQMITFDQYAEIKMDNVWEGNQNPVLYDVRLNLDVSELEFSENIVEIPEYNPPQSYESFDRNTSQGLSIDEAKQGLAKTFSVDTDAIEITIRG